MVRTWGGLLQNLDTHRRLFLSFDPSKMCKLQKERHSLIIIILCNGSSLAQNKSGFFAPASQITCLVPRVLPEQWMAASSSGCRLQRPVNDVIILNNKHQCKDCTESEEKKWSVSVSGMHSCVDSLVGHPWETRIYLQTYRRHQHFFLEQTFTVCTVSLPLCSPCLSFYLLSMCVDSYLSTHQFPRCSHNLAWNVLHTQGYGFSTWG